MSTSVRTVRESTTALITAGASYAGCLVLSLLLGAEVDQSSWLIALHAGSAVSFFAYWRLSAWGEARYDSFGGALLLFAILQKLIALLDTVLYGTRIQTWPATLVSYDIISALYVGEIITQAGYLLTVLAWRLALQWNFTSMGIFERGHGKSRTVWFSYLAALAFELGQRGFGASFGPASQILFAVKMFGVGAILLIAFDKKHPAHAAITAFLLGLPFSALALGIGMKEDLLLPLVPAGILAWRACSGMTTRGLFLLAAIAVFGLSQSYVHHVRSTVWVNDERSTADKLVTDFAHELYSTGGEPLAQGIETFFSRANLTLTHAITIEVARQYGHLPGEIFGPIPATFIPRALWPEKPVLMPGAQHTVRIRGSGSVEDARSATAAGFYTELYLGGWLFGLVGGGLALGCLQGLLARRIRRRGSLATLALFNYAQFYSALRHDEEHVVYIFTGILLTYLVHTAFLRILPRLTWSGRRSRSASRLRPMPSVPDGCQHRP